jgi:hypothetical protein
MAVQDGHQVHKAGIYYLDLSFVRAVCMLKCVQSMQVYYIKFNHNYTEAVLTLTKFLEPGQAFSLNKKPAKARTAMFVYKNMYVWIHI